MNQHLRILQSEMRLLPLLLALLTLLPLDGFAQQMPPYPDVWDLQVPNPAPGSRLRAILLNDGQVVIAYGPDGPPGKAGFEKLFFGGGTVKQKRLADGQRVFTYEDGRHASVSALDSFSAQLQDGRTIRNADNAYRDCYRGPARDFLSIKGEDRSQRLTRVFFYLLEKPKRFVSTVNDNWRGLETGSSCPSEPSLNLEVSVESMSGSFLPLPDGTILLLDHAHGLVLRLTKDLESHSKLMNDRVFAFPYNDSYLFVGLLFGKDYGSGEEQSIRFQEALDDLRDYLRKIKNEQRGKAARSESAVKGESISPGSCLRNDRGIFEDINCAIEARDAVDRELNEIYRTLLARLRPSEEKLLRQAQRDWLEFVEADAKFTFEREGDGSSGRLIAVNYRERLTRERLAALKSWLP